MVKGFAHLELALGTKLTDQGGVKGLTHHMFSENVFQTSYTLFKSVFQKTLFKNLMRINVLKYVF